MHRNLTIDHGNSRVKISVWNCDGNRTECVCGRCFRTFTPADLREVFSDCRPDRAIWCSVASDDDCVLTALHALCADVIHLTADTPTPLTIDYGTPATLGVDRIAAAVGAWSLDDCRGRDILVADIGTAITYDRVTADSRYCGGNIAPGIYMRLRALNHYTARLPLVEVDGQLPAWGDTTETALRAGAVNGVVAELEFYKKQLPADAAAVLTGGAARVVADRLSFSPAVVTDLVNRGLNAIIEYNHR